MTEHPIAEADPVTALFGPRSPVGHGLRGLYRDRVGNPDDPCEDRGWRRNTVVTDGLRLLAALMKGVDKSSGIAGLLVGGGNPAWDTGTTPAPTPGQTALVDPNPFLVPLASLTIDFLDGSNVTANPTPRLQIKATLGPNLPPWPDANHVVANLREFGLVGQLAGQPTLINYVTHPVILKDPASTLTRTIWLVL